MAITAMELLIIIFITLGIVALLGVLLYQNRYYKESRYNDKLMRAEISKLRDYYEHKIYDITDKMMSYDNRWKDINHLLINSQAKIISKIEENIVSTPFLEEFNISEKNTRIDQKSVFILTPFNQRHYSIYKTITVICSELGLKSSRGDEHFIEGEILSHILKSIVSCRFVIANVDGRNPNVYYEMGIAHALGKTVLMVTSDIKKLPVDASFRQLNILVYKNLDDLKLQLPKYINKLLISQK